MKKTYFSLCLLLALTLAGCGAAPEEPVLDPTVTVETAAAQLGKLGAEGRYVGTVSSEGTATVVALVSGRVEEVAVSVGDQVSAEQLLCRFDDESARLTMSNAQAAYQAAQGSYNSLRASYGGTADGSLKVLEEQVRMAQENYDNAQTLLEVGAVSQVEVDSARQTLLTAQSALNAAQAGLEQARSGLQQAQVGLDSAQYQLTLYHLTAPISGVVEAVNVLENNFTPSGTAAFVISNAENKTITFYVTNEVRKTLRQGQEVTVSNSGERYTGSVTEISGVVNPGTGLFQVKAVAEEAQALPDGLTVELSTTAYIQENAVLIPSSAVYFQDGNAYVYLAEGEVARRRDVAVGLYTAETIAVTEGLSGGEEIITSWSAGLKDGAPIRLAAEAPADGGETEG